MRPVVLLTALLFAAVANASNLSYSKAEIGIIAIHFDEPGYIAGYEIEGESGIQYALSYQPTDNLFFGVDGYTAGNESEDSVVEINDSLTNIYVGGVVGVGQDVDVFGKVGLVSGEVEVCYYSVCAKADDEGTALQVGVRAAITDVIELNGRVTRYNFDKFDDDTVPEFGAIFHINEHHGIVVSRSHWESSTGTAVGYRYSW